MKAVMITRFGAAVDIAEVCEIPEPSPPEAGEIVIDVLAAPINPSDFLNFQGRFGAQPPALPIRAGGEALGRVAAVGAGVRHLKVGDRVLALAAGRGNWCQQVKARAEGVEALPEGADTLQLAMMAVNPATAWHMLKRFVTLERGAWVLQNAGNSAVGHNVMQIARSMGIRTVSIVRHEDQASTLRAAGADAVVVDGADLTCRVQEAVAGAPIRLAFDAVAGSGTRDLARCVANGGTVVTYGLLSSSECVVDASDLVFRNIALRGFWFTPWYETAPASERNEVYRDIARLIDERIIAVNIEGTYPITRVRDALVHAARTQRSGKVLLLPNPHLFAG